MANPQLENGYVRIANEIWDEVIRRDFSKRQKDILFFIWRLSYGCRGKTSAYIPKLVYFELVGIGKNHIKDQLLILESSGVIFWDREANIFSVNKDFDQWEIPQVRAWKEFRFDEILSLNLEESSQKGNKKVPETGTKKFPKREHSDEDEDKKFPKREQESSQKGNKVSEKVPEMGTSMPDEPFTGAASGLPKDIFKDSIKDSRRTKILSTVQDTVQVAAAAPYPFQRIYEIYEQHFSESGKVTEFEAQELEALYGNYGGEWLYQAMREAALHKGMSLAYVRAVLKGFRQRGGTDSNKAPPGSPKEYQVDSNDPITQLLREYGGVGD